jgi:hypothetical protein
MDSVLLELTAEHEIMLPRAPSVVDACRAACTDTPKGPYICSLRELLGIVGSFEWRRKGVLVAALGQKVVYPHYGVFAPTRQDYINFLSSIPLPASLTPDSLAMDIGTGTGVLAATLIHRGVSRVVATDSNPRAVACARENIERLGMNESISVLLADIFPPPAERAALILCNPPWLPGNPSSSLEKSVFDPSNHMLHGFLKGLHRYLLPKGEGWLIMSNIAEIVGLRSRESFLQTVEQSGLIVLRKFDYCASNILYEKEDEKDDSDDANDIMITARKKEVISVWKFGLRET